MNNLTNYLKYSLIKNIFLVANEWGFDIEDFVLNFMKSNLGEKIFLYSKDHFYNEESVVSELSKNVKSKDFNSVSDEILISYLAFIYVHFYNVTGMVPSKIIQYLPINYIISNFNRFHLLDENVVVDMAISDFNKKSNSLRKERNTSNDISSLAKNETLALYLSKEIYSKLFPYSYLANLEYKFEKFPYFISERHFFYSKIVKRNEELIEVLRDPTLEYYAFNKKEAIKAIILDKKMICDDSLLRIVKNNILITSMFTKTLLIIDRICYVFNSIGEFSKYYFVFSPNDEKRLLNKFNNRNN